MRYLLTLIFVLLSFHAGAQDVSRYPTPTFLRATIGVLPPAPNSSGLLDLITSKPNNGTFISGEGSPIKCEPVLGPFHPDPNLDLSRCNTVRYWTPTGNYDRGEYGTVFNMITRTGFPEQCKRNTRYYEFSSCINDNGKMYNVKIGSGGGTTAAFGTGPTGTNPTQDQQDGTVIWNYNTNFTPLNGGKTNISAFTYQEANASSTWTGAFAHQIAEGGPKKTAFTLELDMNNHWGDYNTLPAGPAAAALQIFLGGPYRSSKAIGIGQHTIPDLGKFNLVNGIELCCASLVSDNTIVDLTGSVNGIANFGAHTGSAFTDGSSSAISFNSFGGADVGFRHTGASAVGLRLEGTYAGFQVQGQNWNVNPAGVLSAAGVSVSTGAFKPAQYTVARLFPCVAGSKGSVVVVTDLPANPTYRQLISAGGGTETALALCTGTAWVVH